VISGRGLALAGPRLFFRSVGARSRAISILRLPRAFQTRALRYSGLSSWLARHSRVGVSTILSPLSGLDHFSLSPTACESVTKLVPSAEADSFHPTLPSPALTCRAFLYRRSAAGASFVPPSLFSIDFRNSLLRRGLHSYAASLLRGAGAYYTARSAAAQFLSGSRVDSNPPLGLFNPRRVRI
jgi:hypothetical protein